MYQLENLHLRLTAHCNKRCEHCFAHLDDYAPEKSYDYWKGLILTAEKMKVSSVTLTGGEPFVYHDIIPLLECLPEFNVPFKIETNGLLLEKFASTLQKIPTLKQIALSPGLHYDDAYMESLQNRVLDFRATGLPVILQANVLSQDLEHQLLWLEKLALTGIPIRMMVGHNGLGHSKDLSNVPFDVMLSIGRRYVDHPMIRCDLPGRLLDKTTSKGCGWNRNRADILPDGSLTPCAAIAWNYPDFVLDYVDGSTLEDVWNTNEYLNRIRNLKQSDFGGHCSQCSHFDTCQSSCVATSLGMCNDLFFGYPLCTFAERKKQDERCKPIDKNI